MPSLTEIFLITEGAVERRWCGLALCHPHFVAKSNIRPERDLAALAFFKKFDGRKADILAAGIDAAINIALGCCEPRDGFSFLAAIDEINSLAEAPNISADLMALRAVRKSVQWIESSGLLQEARYGG